MPIELTLRGKLPKTIPELHAERDALVDQLEMLKEQLRDPKARSRYETDKDYKEWKSKAGGLKLMIERRLRDFNNCLRQRHEERDLGEASLLLDGRELDPKSSHSLLHALWKLHMHMRKKGVEYGTAELLLIREARDFLIARKYIPPVKKVVVRPKNMETSEQIESQ